MVMGWGTEAGDLPTRISRIFEIASLSVVALTTIAVPLVFVQSGSDVFRLPQELALRGGAIVLAAIAVCAIVLAGRRERTPWPRDLALLVVLVLCWATLTTVVSSNRMLSILSLLFVSAAAMLFVAAYNGAAKAPLWIAYAGFVPACVNAILAILQRTGVFSPFPLKKPFIGRSATLGLLGNPDYVGTYLAVPAIAAIALAVAVPRERLRAGFVAVLLLAGLAMTQTVGAAAAVAAGLIVLIGRRSWRVAAATACLAVIVLALFIGSSAHRRVQIRESLGAGKVATLDTLLSGRLPAFLAALQMFREHPLMGVGLGCFPYQYFDARVAIDRGNPELANVHVENFGETHNEHLQMLAEGGAPSYALFLAALFILGRRAFAPRREGDERSAFAATAALPLAAAFFVLAMAQFPMRLAAATTAFVFFSATTLAWSADDRA